MRKNLLLCFLFIVCCLTLNAAYLKNVPQTLLQPNGDTLYCFASGDEYYHWLHDANNYTIVQNPQTGYFVYATAENGRIIPTEYIAGKVNPHAVGLVPNLKISAQEWQTRKEKMWKDVPCKNTPKTGNQNKGIYNNLVIFIKFAGDGDFINSFASVNSMFNDSTSFGVNSMYNYFKNISYNQLFINSFFFPQPENDVIIAYEDTYPKEYYMPYSETNPMGYDASEESWDRTGREMTLLANAVRYVADMIPTDLNLDYNNDGYVDNVCFVVKGDVGGWNDLLWPHRWELYYDDVEINGKRVYDFNFQLSDNSYYFATSTLCHEMFHSLGAPDLYHYYDENDFAPVGKWDVMAQTTDPRAQNPGAWMKYQYGNWIDEIPTITESGRYTVYHIGGNSNERVAYRIPSEIENEFFLVECRKKSDNFEVGIPESGLLIYRINTDFVGNAGWDGVDFFDEVYIYRPDGTTAENGDLSDAVFKQSKQRTEFNYATNPQPFLTNGYVSMLNIYNIESHIDSITFSYLKPGDTMPTAIPDLEILPENLTIYPNPTTDFVNIDLPDSFTSGELSIYDMSGKLCQYEIMTSTHTVIDASRLRNGIYIMELQMSNGEISYGKLIKE